jgi:hypothetical protein
MGSLDFLPEGRGAQTLHSPSETVNFWARYRLPSRLKEGTYHFQIDAMDVLGGKTSSAPLEFRIKG